MITLTTGLSDVIDVGLNPRRPSEMTSTSLIKFDHLTVICLELPAGRHVPPHQAKGDITILCLSGQIEFTAGEITRSLKAGSLILLAGHELHSLIASEDSTILITVAT